MRLISSKVAVWVLAAGVAFGALPSFADPKIGVVDAQRLLEESPQGKAMLESMRSEFAPRERTLQATQQSLKAKQEKLQKDGATTLTLHTLVEKADGEQLLGSGPTPLREALTAAGFVSTPRGLRLRA